MVYSEYINMNFAYNLIYFFWDTFQDIALVRPLDVMLQNPNNKQKVEVRQSHLATHIKKSNVA